MYFGASPRGKFTNTMHAVVRIGTENKRAIFLERECLSYKLECARRVCGKDDGIPPGRLKE